MAEPACLTCRFFACEGASEGGPFKGRCRRYPPREHTPQPYGWEDDHPGELWDPAWQSPTVRSDYWCGEHQPKSASTKKAVETAITGAGFLMRDSEEDDPATAAHRKLS